MEKDTKIKNVKSIIMKLSDFRKKFEDAGWKVDFYDDGSGIETIFRIGPIQDSYELIPYEEHESFVESILNLQDCEIESIELTEEVVPPDSWHEDLWCARKSFAKKYDILPDWSDIFEQPEQSLKEPDDAIIEEWYKKGYLFDEDIIGIDGKDINLNKLFRNKQFDLIKQNTREGVSVPGSMYTPGIRNACERFAKANNVYKEWVRIEELADIVQITMSNKS